MNTSTSSLIAALSKLGVRVGNLAGGYIANDTLANIVAGFSGPAYINKQAWANDLGPRGTAIIYNGTDWRVNGPQLHVLLSLLKFLVLGLSGATYSQTGTTVTVTWTAHGLTNEFDGASVYLVGSTGALVSGTFTNFVYVDANTFTCTSAISQSTSGNLGTNTSETFSPVQATFPSITGYFKAGDSIALAGFRRAKNSGNNKTFKVYQCGANTASDVMTTQTTWQSLTAGNVTLLNDAATQGMAAGNAILTLTDRLARVSCTLANSTDWMCCMLTAVSVNIRS